MIRCGCGRFARRSDVYLDGTPMSAEEGTYVVLCRRCVRLY